MGVRANKAMSLDGKRILLTGGAGFIGSHLAEALLRRGARLSILDNFDDYYPRVLKEQNLDELRAIGDFEALPVDICNPAELRRAFMKVRPEAVIHLAACVGIQPSLIEPHRYEHVNVGGTINLLELMKEFGVQKFIFSSSSSIYGSSSPAPFVESAVSLRPMSPYACTKLAGELWASNYAQLYRIPTVCLRFFSVYGPRQRPDLAIHKFVALMAQGLPVSLFGEGDSLRDYTYVDDTIAGILGALNYDVLRQSGEMSDVFNLGSNQPVKLIDLIHSIESVMGIKAILEFHKPKAGDMPYTYADITKASERLGFAPLTPLREGIEKFVAWFRARSVLHGAYAPLDRPKDPT
jgi:UDP-glucuronate 4-epimerase